MNILLSRILKYLNGTLFLDDAYRFCVFFILHYQDFDSYTIEDIAGDHTDHLIDILIEVYTSWIDDAISNYNTDFYYQSREYIFECYREGKICA